ncbi:DUF5694 domain-containing protein [Gillisia limnaea]|uniref:Uncharacterized protein n=1 Tax=Gillisia limnaea (strain DSM 15749 / LMG 21470 / R-8282) TaxID=865937 RepID=H2BXK4_GILLR|nr:DUF5694 domain-containing protein [Gillisia limnaea]EHQ03128.1 hypothetical protein Gilli_2504 [Gillisia limnaea DSM 15749]
MRITVIMMVLLNIQLQAQEFKKPVKFKNTVKVLNMGTFHMGYTPDANTTEFDEHDQRNIDQVHKIAQSIAEFKPTVILVESLPERNSEVQKNYKDYVDNPEMKFKNPSELELLAFEVGRLAGTERIYGIDYKEGYNYRIAEKINDNYGIETYKKYFSILDSLEKQFPEEEMSVLQKLQMSNNPIYKDMLLNINADILTHISTEGNAEGADEAAKFYHRNLVMYSNLNQIKLGEDDRVFILMGATHTAFFDMWIERSPKYEIINTSNYLK